MIEDNHNGNSKIKDYSFYLIEEKKTGVGKTLNKTFLMQIIFPKIKHQVKNQ